MLLLVPNSKMKQIFRLVVSVFFLCCLISPLLLKYPELEEFRTDYDTSYQEKTEELDETVKKQLREQINQKVGTVISELLERSKIFPQRVDVFISTDDPESIAIREILIKLPQEYESRENSVSQLIEREIGITPKLVF